MNIDQYRTYFEKTVNDNNFPSFNDCEIEILNHYRSFQDSRANGPTPVGSHNAIFGETGFYLNQTNDIQAQQLLEGGRAASDVLATLSIDERLEFLSILERKLKEHTEEEMLVITADTGKPIDLSATEIEKGNAVFGFAYKKAKAQLATRIEHEAEQDLIISADPLGVAQIIGAYNYPYALAMTGIIGALTAGNGVVVSAPLKAPNWVFPFIQAAQEATEEYTTKAFQEGKPWAAEFAAIAPKLIQYSVGRNDHLTHEADIVHFVGSNATGEAIRQSRGLKKTILEMGGSNVGVVMASAIQRPEDAQKIADIITAAFAPSTGQRCTALRMLIVQYGAEAVLDNLFRICAAGPGELLGNPFTKGVKMGPLVDGYAHQKMQEAIDLAHKVGAKVFGNLKVNDERIPPSLNQHSYWVNPIAIDWRSANLAEGNNAKDLHECLSHEIFGPLIHVLPQIHDLNEGIEKTNALDTNGLAGALFTNDPNDVKRYQAKTKVTSLSVNEASKDRSPWGPHGHPGLDTIGSDGHFRLYTRARVLAGKFPAPSPN